MKLLMFHTKTFWYKPYNQDSSETEKTSFENCLVIFIHVEETDRDKSDVVGKAAGNIKWLADKNKTSSVVLHSFAHLSNSKSDPETAKDMIQKISEKLKKNLSAHIIPFRQFYEFSIHVFGPSLAKVFKDCFLSFFTPPHSATNNYGRISSGHFFGTFSHSNQDCQMFSFKPFSFQRIGR